jgi:hypothetical protein
VTEVQRAPPEATDAQTAADAESGDAATSARGTGTGGAAGVDAAGVDAAGVDARTRDAGRADAGSADVAADSVTGVESAGDDDGQPAGKHRRRQRPSDVARLRRQRRRVVIGLALLPLIGATLMTVGLNRVWTGTLGRYVPAGLDPDQPNYAALVTPTPTFLVLHVDGAGQLAGLALLSLRSGDEGGSVIVIPVGTQVPGSGAVGTGEGDAPDAVDGADPDDSPVTLREAYADGGTRGVELAVQNLLNVAVADTQVRDDPGWARMVAPVAPLALTLPEGLDDRWPAGSVQLEAADVGEFLRTSRDDEESELNRVSRAELFWEAWIEAVSQGDDEAVPGDVDTGISRFVRGLGAGASTVHSLPVAPLAESAGVQEPDGMPATDDSEVFVSDDALVSELVATAIPYPEEPATGSRVRVKLLNGTEDEDLALRAVEPLVRSGAQIAISGNAASFSETRTRFVYTDDDNEGRAILMREALGVGTVELASSERDTEHIDEDERIDVTVILGRDALGAIRRLESSG